jgi:hypothetical protein
LHHAEGDVGVGGGTSGLVASVVGIATAPTRFWANLYPDVVVGLLSTTLIAALIWGWRRGHRASVDSADQARLNHVLRAIPRAAIRDLERAHFSAGWDDRVARPFAAFVDLHDVVERQFGDARLEVLWRELLEASGTFVDVEALKRVDPRDTRGHAQRRLYQR